MFDLIFVKFTELPIWARWFSVFVFFCMLGGLEDAWGKRRFIAEFSEATFAYGLHWASIGIACWGAFKSCEIIDVKYNSKALPWVVAVFVFVIVSGTLGLLITQIPGVGWRLSNNGY